MTAPAALDLADQVAVVTGAGSGVGRAIAIALAQNGAHLVLPGRNTAGLELVAAEARAAGRSVLVGRHDLTVAAEVEAMAEAARRTFAGRIDILVNAAGGTGGVTAPVWEIPAASFDAILALNLTASFLTMAAVMPAMIARRYGRIVNIGGTYGLRGRAGRAAYSAAKWGLRGLTKSAALDAGRHNITVNCVSPGLIEGPRLDEATADLAHRKKMSIADAERELAEAYALHRISAPEDVAGMVVFLASARARQVTGQDLVVDGGWAI